jgi:hypothetical protein
MRLTFANVGEVVSFRSLSSFIMTFLGQNSRRPHKGARAYVAHLRGGARSVAAAIVVGLSGHVRAGRQAARWAGGSLLQAARPTAGDAIMRLWAGRRRRRGRYHGNTAHEGSKVEALRAFAIRLFSDHARRTRLVDGRRFRLALRLAADELAVNVFALEFDFDDELRRALTQSHQWSLRERRGIDVADCAQQQHRANNERSEEAGLAHRLLSAPSEPASVGTAMLPQARLQIWQRWW